MRRIGYETYSWYSCWSHGDINLPISCICRKQHSCRYPAQGKKTRMIAEDLAARLTTVERNSENHLELLDLPGGETVQIYPNSIQKNENLFVFMGRRKETKRFWALILGAAESSLKGEFTEIRGGRLLCCALNHKNAVIIRKRFDFTRPVLLGTEDSFGYGDRLGIANPAHVRVAAEYRMRPIFAQQSIRELTRTEREAEEVMDAATWAVLQEGYKQGFGADADHLKTTQDVDRMVRAGFTFFTIDPSDHVINEADKLSAASLDEKAESLKLPDSLENLIGRYEDQSISISRDFVLQPDREQILRAIIKYSGVVTHAEALYRHLKQNHPNHPVEVELSVDETESVTSPFEHYFVVQELKRLGVQLVSLAPRFIGHFEKGIDYKGDLKEFRKEYLKHAKIAQKLGPYKISFHSGSDKFSAYQEIGPLHEGPVHVKTAGTSYLEALRTVAQCDPLLFGEILDFARGLYETEKKTYHVSAELKNVPGAKDCEAEDLEALFDQNDARQVLHVTFGKVLTERAKSGEYRFRDDIFRCLQINEDAHYDNLIRHFRRHLDPFK